MLTDYQLIARAGHAGRNLTALAILTSIVCVVQLFITTSFSAVPGTTVFYLNKLILLLTVVASWLMAIAARRGEQHVVAYTMVLWIANSFAMMVFYSYCLADLAFNAFFLVIGGGMGITIFWLLARSRTVLLRLKEQGLWDEAFGSHASGRNIGNAAICISIACVFSGYAININQFSRVMSLTKDVGRNHRFLMDNMQLASRFANIIKIDEARVFISMQDIRTKGKPAIANTLASINILEYEFNQFKKSTASNVEWLELNEHYGDTIGNWRSGIEMFDSDPPDHVAIEKMLVSGDQSRKKAMEIFKNLTDRLQKVQAVKSQFYN